MPTVPLKTPAITPNIDPDHKKSSVCRQMIFQRVNKHNLFIFLTRWETLKNGSEFVKPVSSAYMGTVESGLADSRKIQLKCGISRIFSLFRGN